MAGMSSSRRAANLRKRVEAGRNGRTVRQLATAAAADVYPYGDGASAGTAEV